MYWIVIRQHNNIGYLPSNSLSRSRQLHLLSDAPPSPWMIFFCVSEIQAWYIRYQRQEEMTENIHMFRHKFPQNTNSLKGQPHKENCHTGDN